MKTVEQLAGEYAKGREGINIGKSFIAGYNKAKEWISVEEELPELLDTDYDVLAKDEDENKYIWKIYSDGELNQFSNNITHWKYID